MPTGELISIAGEGKGATQTQTRQITVPKGEARIIRVKTETDETPGENGICAINAGGGSFNDRVSWRIQTQIAGATSAYGFLEEGTKTASQILQEDPDYKQDALLIARAELEHDLLIDVEITSTNIADGSCPSTVLVDVLPFSVKANQTQGGPYGSRKVYLNAPSKGYLANLVSLWTAEPLDLEIKLPSEIPQTDLPDDFITWSIPGHTVPSNSLTATVSWNSPVFSNTNTSRLVFINTGGTAFAVHIEHPGVGSLDEDEAALLTPNAFIQIWLLSDPARDKALEKFPNNAPRRDAFRHSFWCSTSVSTLGVTKPDIELVSRAHEYHGSEIGDTAFNSTMDLHNNEVGYNLNLQVNGLPDEDNIIINLDLKYVTGELYVWETYGDHSVDHYASEGIVLKSND